MDVKVKNLPKAEIEVNIKITDDEFKKYLEKASVEISKEVKVDGFREGKVPMSVLEEHVGKDTIANHALDLMLPEVLTNVVKKEKLEVISRPKIEVVSKDPVEIKAIFVIYPEVKVDGYKKIKVKTQESKISDKDVDEAVEMMKKQLTEWKEVEEPIKKGHKAEIDFEGFDEGGAVLEGTKSKNHPLLIGESMMVKGFEEELIGLKKGEEKEFNLTFPKDYHKESFKNKKVKFKVKVNKVENPEVPEINEEFIEKVSGKKESVEDYRKRLAEELKKYKEADEKRRQENVLLEEIAKVTKVDLSDILIEDEVNHMLREIQQELAQKGVRFEDYLKQVKKTEEEMRTQMKKDALQRLSIRFGLHEIMEQEKIEVTDKDAEEEIAKMAQAYGDQQPQTPETKARVKNSIRISRLFETLLGK